LQAFGKFLELLLGLLLVEPVDAVKLIQDIAQLHEFVSR
jgi:hypothetical protein